MHDMLSEVSDLFTQFGGHAGACGFSMKQENLNIFREKMQDAVKKRIEKEPDILEEQIYIAKKLLPEEKTIEFALTIPGVSSSLFLLKRVLILEKLKKFKKALKVLNLVRLENLDSEMLSTIKDVEDRIKGKRKIGRKSKK